MSVANETISVLLVSSSPEAQSSIRTIFTHSRWRISQASSRAQAISFLNANPTPVVIADADLADGSWRDLFDNTASIPNPPLLIVASNRADDRLWAEALNLGAQDVLAKPFRAAEVFHSVSLAWRRWKDAALLASAAAG